MKDRSKGRIILLCVYLIACSIGFWFSKTFVSDVSEGSAWANSILASSAIAVLVTVAIIFLSSVVFNNSSMFDPYWSVAPPLMVLFYVAGILLSMPDIGNAGYGLAVFLLNSPRVVILFLLAVAYSVRLTWNFLHGWPGMKHEDWRYVEFRNNTGKAYWIVSLLGIHLFPALMVFGGTLSVWVVVVQGTQQLNLVDILAILVTGKGILLEAVADHQLRKFVIRNKEAGKTMNQGLWSLSRHPNYLGEITFWWGLSLFAIAANPSLWWVIIGPLAISLMFVFASIPMIEKRMLARRSDYAAYQKSVSMLVPWKVFTSLPS
jgi:steroid 5-alpha reductase family enzyme